MSWMAEPNEEQGEWEEVNETDEEQEQQLVMIL